MKINEMKEANKELGLYMTYSWFDNEDTLCRRLVLQKCGTPHIVSEDHEIYIRDGDWVSPHGQAMIYINYLNETVKSRLETSIGCYILANIYNEWEYDLFDAYSVVSNFVPAWFIPCRESYNGY